MDTLLKRIENPNSGLDKLPSDNEWNQFRNLAVLVLVALGEKIPETGLAGRAEFERLKERYPGAKWESLPDAVLKVLNQHAAPFDRLRAGFSKLLRQASEVELKNKDKEVGLVWWVLEKAQWNGVEKKDLTLSQWECLGFILRKYANDVSRLSIKKGANNRQDELEALWEYASTLLKGMKMDGVECRREKGAIFSRQLNHLWFLKSQRIQNDIMAISHVRGGRYGANAYYTAGEFTAELRPATAEDLYSDNKRRQTRERQRKYRARKKGGNSVTGAG